MYIDKNLRDQWRKKSIAEKKKILYIVEAMGGGVFTYIVDLANELVNSYDMYIAYAVRKQTPENYKDYFDKRIHLIEVKNFGRAIDPAKDIAAFFEVKKIAAKIKPDVIHLHSSKAGTIGRVAFYGNIPMFYTPHGYSFLMENYKPMKRRMFKVIESVCAKKKAIYTAIEKIAAPFCEKIICISEAERQSALDKKICKEDKLQVIFNGVDIEAYENGVHGAVKREDLNIPDDAFVIGMVGRMSPQKAPDVFVKMAKQVKEKVLMHTSLLLATEIKKPKLESMWRTMVSQTACILQAGLITR